MKNKRTILGILVVVALVALAIVAHHRIHFNWQVFVSQLRQADWKKFAAGIGFIYLAYGLRAIRWSLYLKPVKRIGPQKLLGTQIIGFTAFALFGRLADLVRPYLVSKRTNLPLSSQIAVYTVERMFDMGTVAVIFSTVLLIAPDRHTLPRPDLVNKAALMGLLAALFLGFFAGIARLAGKPAAGLAKRGLGAISPRLGEGVSEKILAFRDGLNAIASLGDLLLIVLISLGMWLLIAFSYLETARAFTASPQLAGLTLSHCMLLMAASMGSSLVQLPIVGWFTQIGLTTAAMQALFHAAPEPALGCGAMLLVVTLLSVIPTGLIWARFEHVSLKKVAEDSEHAGEELAAEEAAAAVSEA